MEYFDVLTEKGEKTGIVKPRTEVHRDGDWHASVHVWILNSQGELLLQRRSPKKDTGSNMWDISYGGHIQAGNSSLTEAFREGSEELGLTITAHDLTHIFTVTQVHSHSTQLDREFNDVYLIQKDLDISTLTLQEEEVAEVRFMLWRDVQRHITAKDATFCVHDEEYAALFAYLEAHPNQVA
jgi:isopentenyldiphosphate isomerase